MAAPKAAEPLDVLEQMINEVIVQSGKIIRENNNRNGKKSTAIASAQRITQANAKFNAALGDLEVDIIRAKSALLRDLAQLQAKKNPVPEPQMIPQAPTAPMMIDLESPKLQHSSVASQAPNKPPGKVEAKQAAPFPNMGIEPAKGPSPKPGVKARPSQSPQPMSRIGSQGVKATGKVGSPATKVGSPAMAKSVSPAMTKAASPALSKTASPSLAKANAASALGGKTGSPAVKNASPVVKAGGPPSFKTASPNVTTKPNPKVTPSPGISKAAPAMPATAPAPTPVMNPNPAPTPSMTIPTVPAAAPQPAAVNTDNSLSSLFDMTSPPTTTAPEGTSAGLNFTDMQFSLAPPAGDSRTQMPSMDEDFDIEAYTADAVQSLITDDNFGIGGTSENTGTNQAEVPNMDVAMGGTAPISSGPPMPDGKAPEPQMDDLFNLNGTSLDMGDLDMGGEGVETSFDDLFFETGDTAMEEFDDAYFGLQ